MRCKNKPSNATFTQPPGLLPAKNCPKMADWSTLPPELCLQIAKRVGRSEDFAAFRAACTAWHSAVGEKDYKPSLQENVPLLMLADENGEFHAFYCPRRRRITRIALPVATRGRKCLTSKGWLVTVDKNLDICIVHVLSGARILLPGLEDHSRSNTGELIEDRLIHKITLSSEFTASKDLTVAAIYGMTNDVAIWRQGDTRWRCMTQPLNIGSGGCAEVTYHMGGFYGISYSGVVFEFGVAGPDEAQVKRVLAAVPLVSQNSQFGAHKQQPYLVGVSSGPLLVVMRNYDCVGTVGFEVYKVDAKTGRLEWESCLSDKSLFLGQSSTLCFQITHQCAYQSNCIYFTPQTPFTTTFFPELAVHTTSWPSTFCDMGVYKLSDRCAYEYFNAAAYQSVISPPLWILPGSAV